MDELLWDLLYPVMLGSNTLCHACVRRMERDFGVPSTVLTGKRALTLRFLPSVTLVHAPPLLADDVLLSLLADLGEEGGATRIPLLVLCDEAYEGFVARNRAALESYYVLRRAQAVLGERDL